MLATSSARAQAAPEAFRSDGYYWAHGGLTLALAGASLAIAAAGDSQPAGSDATWFPGDLGVRANRSPAARALSNITAPVTFAVPPAALAYLGPRERFVNATMVYAEAMAGQTFLNTLVKYTVRRPRPYTYQSGEERAREDTDSHLSFYSGHASSTFTAAVSGSYLFAEASANGAARCFMWGSELALAAATANFRVRAGKHYYSDVLVGALVGVALGIGAPLAHGATYRPSPLEYVSAGGGVGIGILVSQLLPISRDAKSEASMPWLLAPATDGSAGIRWVGVF